MSGVRCFVGLPLAEDVRRRLVAGCEAVRKAAPDWRGEKWVAEGNLHVTVAFLGNVAEEAVGPLAEKIGEAVAGSPAFDLPYSRIRAVPGLRHCRMLWADFDDDGACALLADRVYGAARAFGAEQSERPFSAHVTLARARRPRTLAALAIEAANDAGDSLPRPMSVASATLFASTLMPAGPLYEPLGTWQLKRV